MCRWSGGGGDNEGGEDDGFRYGLMYVVHVRDRSGGGGGSSYGESVGNLVGIFIMDMDFFE